MSSSRFDDLHKKASGFFGESMRILKDSLHEAGRLVNATADATKLHIEKEQYVVGTHRDYHRLGQEVYRLHKQNPKASSIALDEPMRELMDRIHAAEEEITRHRDRLSHLSVVGSATAASGSERSSGTRGKKRAAKPPAKKTGGAKKKKTGVPRRPATRKGKSTRAAKR